MRRACFSNSYLFGRRNSGYVKGTITNVVRYHFVPTDVRRHRLISISYMSLLPCHGSTTETGRVRWAAGARCLQNVRLERLLDARDLNIC